MKRLSYLKGKGLLREQRQPANQKNSNALKLFINRSYGKESMCFFKETKKKK
jgi:hypothetical protein